MPFTSVVSPAEGTMVEDLLVLLLGLLLLSLLVPDCADTQLGVHRRARHKQQTPRLLRNLTMLLLNNLQVLRHQRARESSPFSCSTTRAFLHDQNPALTPSLQRKKP